MRKLFEKLSLITLSSTLWWLTEHLLDKEVDKVFATMARVFLHSQN
jgi:hypothetical protein